MTHFTLRTLILLLTILFILSATTYADSGGPLSANQAAYDVNYYDLDLEINPTAQTIGGSLLCRVEIINQIDSLVLDLDNPFTVDSILFMLNDGTYSNVTFSHAAGKVYINIPVSVTIGDMVTVQIFYYGAPRIASNPPWGVGFVWETTSGGDPWIGVACEGDGADIWWPCKDHPSDEPDSMSMSFTVPNPLTCVSNGKFIGSVDNGNGTSTFNWFISTPINNYNVSIYAAEYSLIEDTYLSVSGDSIPFYFWVLPQYYNTAVNHMNVFLTEFNFLESICGPFPFGTDKHGWAHSSYWGMEHQTIIAYGHNFTVNSWGLDYIHYHELAHEWWGNLITAKDWADVWIHEGMATYTEALYVEDLSGIDSYHQYMFYKRPSDNHTQPLAPRAALTASQGFSLNPYNRGASVMHTLRYHLGDAAFFNLFERWAYPDSTDFNNTNGRLCRILSTDDMKNQAEAETGIELDPFFEVFFREASYPILRVERGLNEANFTWDTETNVLLDVNIPITLNGADSTVEMTAGQGSMSILLSDNLVIDPKQWILMADPVIIVNSIEKDLAQVTDFQLEQNYPNPFNPTTTIKYALPKAAHVNLEVFTITGKKIKVLVNEKKQSGYHTMLFNGSDLSSGVYFYKITTNAGYAASKKFILLK